MTETLESFSRGRSPPSQLCGLKRSTLSGTFFSVHWGGCAAKVS